MTQQHYYIDLDALLSETDGELRSEQLAESEERSDRDAVHPVDAMAAECSELLDAVALRVKTHRAQGTSYFGTPQDLARLETIKHLLQAALQMPTS
jgi:hypothetical protein